MKVERVSYDVMTPSAARAIFEAILWRPAIRWRVHSIEVLAPIRWTSLRRNEVASVVPVGSVREAMAAGKGSLGLHVEDDRQQRAGLILRDVAYRIHATFQVTGRAGPTDNPTKFVEMFERRAERGQCFHQPYLGCREFACDFRLVTERPGSPPPIPEDRDLGYMLFDLDYQDPAQPSPRFFRAALRAGVLTVPAPESPGVLA